MPNELTPLIVPDPELERIKACIQKIKSETRTWAFSASTGVVALIPTAFFIFGIVLFNLAGKEPAVLRKYANSTDGSFPVAGTCGQVEPLSDVCASRDYSINGLCEQTADTLCSDDTPYNKALDFLIVGGAFAAVLWLLTIYFYCKITSPQVVNDLTDDIKASLQELNLPIQGNASIQEALTYLQDLVTQKTLRVGSDNRLARPAAEEVPQVLHQPAP